MKARDVMVSPVITVKPYSSVREIAKTLINRRISAVPVVDDAGKLVGIVSEGDLTHRSETGTERRFRWWRPPVAGDASIPLNYIKAHGRKAADIMTQNVITAKPETPLDEIAILLERNAIKRVPIVTQGQLVGIVKPGKLSSSARNDAQGIGNPFLRREDSRQIAVAPEGATVGACGSPECHCERRRRQPLGFHQLGNRKEGNSRRR
jgi:CBS-domain-containing membrane protein